MYQKFKTVEAYRYRQNEANENQQRAGVGLDERACTTRTYTKRNAAKQAKAKHVALAFDKPKSLFPEGWAAGVVGVESPGAYEEWQAEAARGPSSNPTPNTKFKLEKEVQIVGQDKKNLRLTSSDMAGRIFGVISYPPVTK